MGRIRYKWKCIIIFYLVLLNIFTKCLPVYDRKISSVISTDTEFKIHEVPLITEDLTTTYSDNTIVSNWFGKAAESAGRSQIRPGQAAERYVIQLTDNGDDFSGRAVIDMTTTTDTINAQLQFHIQGLDIKSVRVGLFTEAGASTVNINIGGNTLRVNPPTKVTHYVVIIEYSGKYTRHGRGFYKGDSGNGTYLAMNLHPIHARRVFPCIDEPTETSTIKFTFNGMDYDHLTSNAKSEDGSPNEMVAFQGAPHVFGMMAHNFVAIATILSDVILYGRADVRDLDPQVTAAIALYYTDLNKWTNKVYTSIHENQNGHMHIVAVPDISTDWHSLSTIGIWEPNIMMQKNHAVKQRKKVFFEIAQAMARQWFGNVITPANWRFEWVISGLASYASYEMMRSFQEYDSDSDNEVNLDVNTLFVTDIIQESLLRDAYPDSQPLEPNANIFDEESIRVHVNGIHKVKAPALLRMMRIVLGDPEQDFIQSAARSLLSVNALQPINSIHLVSGINSEWIADGVKMIDNVNDYLERWRTTVGYPLIHVSRNPGTVLVTLEHFSFAQDRVGNYPIPITFTTSITPDFSDFQPRLVTDDTIRFDVSLGDDDWILFNIQGQGYYRVNYNPDLWENIIDALDEPETREGIHPLNRATLVDDSMNIARAGKLGYDVALEIILTMEHETEYAVWKAFIRNMEFLRKRLIALIENDDDLDEDIYVRMVRRTVLAIEDELGFEPDTNLSEPPMQTLTRGLVMEHACKANHLPCVAAAIDLFYDPNNEDTVNPNIPHELRPAVYCTMVREGEEEVIEALMERLDIEPTIYERIVILESLACSTDEDYIESLLEETIADDSPYSVEESARILAAVLESNYRNVFVAMSFMSTHTREIIDTYGMEKFEELLLVLADNIADADHTARFRQWLTTQHNNLGDSDITTRRALLRVTQNTAWNARYLEEIYEWIDENDASTMVLSFAALCVSIMIGLMNH